MASYWIAGVVLIGEKYKVMGLNERLEINEES